MSETLNKHAVVEAIIEEITREIDVMRAAADAATQATTHSESKAEDHHDTRSTEASYLARGQFERLSQLENLLTYFKNLEPKVFEPTTLASVGSLALLEHNKQKQWYFVSAKPGGTRCQVSHQTILVLSIHSPLGEELVGCKKGDSLQIEGPKGDMHYDVLEIK